MRCRAKLLKYNLKTGNITKQAFYGKRNTTPFKAI